MRLELLTRPDYENTRSRAPKYPSPPHLAPIVVGTLALEPSSADRGIDLVEHSTCGSGGLTGGSSLQRHEMRSPEIGSMLDVSGEEDVPCVSVPSFLPTSHRCLGSVQC